MTSKNTGAGVCTLIFLIFLVLKLAAVGAIAEWSWWWVFAPLWLPLVAMVAVMVLLMIVKIIADCLLGSRETGKNK
jgi:hypothetical protein